MTVYEHAMLGATVALATGCQRRHGWAIVMMAAAAGALPDWDGLSLLLGGAAYSRVHRVWGHNLLAAALGGLLAGVLGLLCHHSARVRQRTLLLLARLGQPMSPAMAVPPLSAQTFCVWVVVGILAGLSHLPADVIYGGGESGLSWPVPLLWPFAERGWVVPLLSWGDFGPTVVFLMEMFALYRWPRRGQLLAWLTLLLLAGYLVVRWLMGMAG
jgi:hypothetical protein